MTTRESGVPVYSYLRFSTGEQKKGDSQRRQTQLAEDWCKKNGLALVQSYADLGVSAFKGKNVGEEAKLGQFLRLVEDGRIPKASILLVESLDRLSRQNVNKALAIFLDIINSGVDVVTLCDGYRYSGSSRDMTQLMMSLMIFARANDESHMKSLRKRASWEKKRLQAANGGTLDGNLPRWLRKANGSYEVIEKEAAVIRRIFADYTAGGLGLWRLERKHKVPKATIQYWLHNPVVIGHLKVTENGQPVELKGHYPAIVDTATWRKAQELRVDRYIHRRRGIQEGAVVSLFAGLLFDQDGNRLGVSHPNGPESRVYTNSFCGYCLQERRVELAILQPLAKKLVIRRWTEQKEDSKAVAALKAKIERVQEEMLDGDVDVLLPVLRGLKEKLRAAEAEQQTVVSERVDYSLVEGLIQDTLTEQQRLQMREIVRASIKRVTLTRVKKLGWIHRVSAAIELTDGETELLSFAYCSRKGYLINCHQNDSDEDVVYQIRAL